MNVNLNWKFFLLIMAVVAVITLGGAWYYFTVYSKKRPSNQYRPPLSRESGGERARQTTSSSPPPSFAAPPTKQHQQPFCSKAAVASVATAAARQFKPAAASAMRAAGVPDWLVVFFGDAADTMTSAESTMTECDEEEDGGGDEVKNVIFYTSDAKRRNVHSISNACRQNGGDENEDEVNFSLRVGKNKHRLTGIDASIRDIFKEIIVTHGGAAKRLKENVTMTVENSGGGASEQSKCFPVFYHEGIHKIAIECLPIHLCIYPNTVHKNRREFENAQDLKVAEKEEAAEYGIHLIQLTYSTTKDSLSVELYRELSDYWRAVKLKCNN